MILLNKLFWTEWKCIQFCNVYYLIILLSFTWKNSFVYQYVEVDMLVCHFQKSETEFDVGFDYLGEAAAIVPWIQRFVQLIWQKVQCSFYFVDIWVIYLQKLLLQITWVMVDLIFSRYGSVYQSVSFSWQ